MVLIPKLPTVARFEHSGSAQEAAKARAAYRGFLTLREDADLDIPILKQAKAEYAELQ